MKNSKDLLSSVLKTTQMGQIGIRSCLKASISEPLRNVLNSQLQEYDAIESEAHALASHRGWELPELDPGRKFLKDRVTRLQLNSSQTDSRIADLLIRENTRGMIRGFRNLHQAEGLDHQIRILSQKLLDCETANIRQMQGFL